MQRHVRTFETRASKIDGNTLDGAAAAIGNLDSYRTVIFPDFFSEAVLQDAVERGFMADNHDWQNRIGTIKSANIVGRELRMVGEFHSDDHSQKIRTQGQERQERGKTNPLSIGFGIAEKRDFRNGQALLDFAKQSGCDMGLFDTENLAADGGKMTGLLRCSRLYEFSPVSVAANDDALASDVRSADSAGSAAATRSMYLGDDIEEEMTMDALYTLMCRLFYRCIYSAICGTYEYDYDADEWSRQKPPLSDALDIIGGGCDEFKKYALAVVEAIMSGADDADTPEDAMTSLRALFGDPDTRKFDDGAHAARSFDNELTAALAAARGCVTRAGAIQAKRSAENRSISGERIKQIRDLRGEFDTLLQGIPQPVNSQVLSLRTASLRLLTLAEP